MLAYLPQHCDEPPFDLCGQECPELSETRVVHWICGSSSLQRIESSTAALESDVKDIKGYMANAQGNQRIQIRFSLTDRRRIGQNFA